MYAQFLNKKLQFPGILTSLGMLFRHMMRPHFLAHLCFVFLVLIKSFLQHKEESFNNALTEQSIYVPILQDLKQGNWYKCHKLQHHAWLDSRGSKLNFPTAAQFQTVAAKVNKFSLNHLQNTIVHNLTCHTFVTLLPISIWYDFFSRFHYFSSLFNFCTIKLQMIISLQEESKQQDKW